MRKYIPEKHVSIPSEAKLAFKGEIYDVYQWQQEMFDGTFETFEMLDRSDTVEVLAIKDNKLILTHQRQPRTDWYYGYPGGRIDDEDPDELEAAKRELREETGMEFKNWKLIATKQPFRKIDWISYTFLATDFINQGEQSLDGGEEINVVEFSWEELQELAHRPDTEFLQFPGFDNIKSIDDLMNLPAIHQY